MRQDRAAQLKVGQRKARRRRAAQWKDDQAALWKEDQAAQFMEAQGKTWQNKERYNNAGQRKECQGSTRQGGAA